MTSFNTSDILILIAFIAIALAAIVLPCLSLFKRDDEQMEKTFDLDYPNPYDGFYEQMFE